MAQCENANIIIGKQLTVAIALACGDADYKNLTYTPLGKINTKQLSYKANTSDTRNDTSGATTSSVVVSTGFELTVAGFVTSNDDITSMQNELIQYYWDELKAGRQPTVWAKIDGENYPRNWFIFMNFTGTDEGANTDDPMSVSFDFTVTDTDVPGVASVDVETVV